ncbi:hypothetical protein QBC41DRAFT_394641 [Cercophora samala]|uniref:Uncharacterized protein n=1 Tax=Cercophora samala TaxID=330535 RepID=A0AA39ZBP1_9PEZI|nr:hypothetical protein QBC41DRAFT_394641 [Cercophora samala]
MPKTPKKPAAAGSPSKPYSKPRSLPGDSSSPANAATSTKWNPVAHVLWESYAKLRPSAEGSLTSKGLPPGWGKKYKGNIAVLLTKANQEADGNTPPDRMALARAQLALNRQDAFRWTVYKSPKEDLKYFWADE